MSCSRLSSVIVCHVLFRTFLLFLVLLWFFFFFFASRRRHTRCALVTGVQTCALPIYVFAYAHLSNRPLSFSARQITAGERFETTPAPNQIGRASCRERVCQYV